MRLRSITPCLIVIVGWLADSGPVAANDAATIALLKTFVDEFVSIEPGSGMFPAEFKMGDDRGTPAERPQRAVKMTRPFAMAKYEVPQNLYEAVMGNNPSRWKGPRNSVEMLSFDDANLFCDKVTQLLRANQLIDETEKIRLPTEAEWEYCCRAGTHTRYSFGDAAQIEGDVSPKASLLNPYAWHTGNAAGNDPPVGALKPNDWGLYDFHGYLWEFTADAWSVDHKQAPGIDDGHGTATPETKLIVMRGGSWKDDFEKLTSSSRMVLPRTAKDAAIGFRCVKDKKK